MFFNAFWSISGWRSSTGFDAYQKEQIISLSKKFQHQVQALELQFSFPTSPDVYSEGDVDIGFWTTVVCHTVFLARNSWKTAKKEKKDRQEFSCSGFLAVTHEFADGSIWTMYMFYRVVRLGIVWVWLWDESTMWLWAEWNILGQVLAFNKQP